VKVVLGILWLALVAGVVIYVTKPHRSSSPSEIPTQDTRELAYKEARQMVLKALPLSSGADFSDYATDQQTGAAEIGRGIWEAWGRVTVQERNHSAVEDWHIAWIRKTKEILYQKVGSNEKGNYATALEASGTFPTGPAAAD